MVLLSAALGFTMSLYFLVGMQNIPPYGSSLLSAFWATFGYVWAVWGEWYAAWDGPWS